MKIVINTLDLKRRSTAMVGHVLGDENSRRSLTKEKAESNSDGVQASQGRRGQDGDDGDGDDGGLVRYFTIL